ncbi:ABC transporter permease [Leekyejoonella antrihumi]|uniref:ABC transporter permease n=1 Tax=Leekyejoonella antrihumi TaxID=1660198 RepID=A0A563DYW7_9MICO|nr:ABC transporter permease [Leekyejoonella antrihumi]TWP35153.1 ABC transporter permease [Leekyejoonella antrihumi]
MIGFILRRLGSAVLVLFTTSAIAFLIFFATPGIDPAARIAGRGASAQTLAQVRSSFGLDKPLPVQYLLMMKHLFVTRDLNSFVNRGEMVVPQIVQAAPITLSLVIGSAIIAVASSFALGLISALYKGRVVDPIIMTLAVLGISIPVFWLGEVANLITQGTLHHSAFSWVPPLGYTPLTQDPIQWALHLLFPWLTMAVMYVGIYSRVLRAELVAAFNEDFVQAARAKGITERRVVLRHALRCALIPVISLFGLDLGVLVGGAALLTEVVFGLPGVGFLTYQALENVDLSMIMGTTIYAAFFVVLMNALVDILHAKLDPRIRHA